MDAFLIDAGEKAVLTAALARSQDGTTVVSVIDGRRARKAANALGINVTGSFGVLKIAKREGRLEAVAPALRAMKAAGIDLPDDAEIRRRWLTPIGETWP